MTRSEVVKLTFFYFPSNDIISQNIAVASNEISYVNIMPVYGLNVYSMLKYETLVLTEAAVNKITEKLLYQFTRIDAHKMNHQFKLSQRN